MRDVCTGIGTAEVQIQPCNTEYATRRCHVESLVLLVEE